MNNKFFSERINKELNAAGFPHNMEERTKAFAKTFKLPTYQANAILLGQRSPSDALLEALAEEFEISQDELRGK